MTVIDHIAFPHVFETILLEVVAYGDWPTVLACRAVSTKSLDIIEAHLFNQIALCRALPNGDGVEARQGVSPFNRLPLLPPPTTANGSDSISSQGKAAAVTSFSRQLAYSTCVDYFGARSTDLESFASALKNLQVLRRPKALDSPIIAPTFVDWRDVTSRGGIALCGGPIVSVGVRPGCKRLILHLSYDPGNPDIRDTTYKLDISEDVMEITLVYDPYPGVASVPGPADTWGHILGMLGNKLMNVVVGAVVRGAKVTFVGVERMLSTWLNLDSSLQGQSLVARVAVLYEEYLREWLQGDNFDGVVYEWSEAKIIRAAPAFKTLEEWNNTAPSLERVQSAYQPAFCTDESLLIPGGQPGKYYEEWDAREAYEADPEAFWDGGNVNYDLIDALTEQAVLDGHDDASYSDDELGNETLEEVLHRFHQVMAGVHFNPNAHQA